jgi:hypothetical protein
MITLLLQPTDSRLFSTLSNHEHYHSTYHLEPANISRALRARAASVVVSLDRFRCLFVRPVPDRIYYVIQDFGLR